MPVVWRLPRRKQLLRVAKTSFETFRCVLSSDEYKVVHPPGRLLRNENEVFLRSYGIMLIPTYK